MKKKLTIIFLYIWFYPILVFGQYRVGDKVLNFTLQDTKGNSVSLFDYQGKTILLNFFTTW